MGVASSMFEPHPPSFWKFIQLLKMFKWCSNDLLISLRVSDFQKSVWECSVHSCSCPCLVRYAHISFNFWTVSQYWIIVQLQDCFRQTRGQKSLPLDKSHYHCTVVRRALINSQLIGTEKTSDHVGHGGKTADHFPCPNRSKWIKYLMSHHTL